MTTLETVIDEAMKLSWRDRANLVDGLIRTLAPPGDDLDADVWSELWAVEIRQRLEAVDRGEIDPRPWQDVCQEMRASLGQRQ